LLASELVEKIKEHIHIFGDLPITITDGYDCVTYSGDFKVTVFNDVTGKSIDVGVGGLDVLE
jgi:hypothetical protein